MRIAGLVATAALAGGCSFATTADGMAPSIPRRVVAEPRTVNVAAYGGEPTYLWSYSRISDEALTAAMQQALAGSGMLEPLVDRAADYQLDATILEIRQPMFSLATRVELGVLWRLRRGGEVLWEETIRSEHTTPFSEALIGTKRCRLATEGAARANIAEALRRIEQLQL